MLTSFSNFRVGGSYEVADNLNAYVSYAKSFIPQIGESRNGDPGCAGSLFYPITDTLEVQVNDFNYT